MTVPRDGDDGGSEMAFAVVMFVLSVLVFLAIRNDEQYRSEPPR
jgi:hypothetical protein